MTEPTPPGLSPAEAARLAIIHRLIPDARGLFAAGLFGVVAYVLWMIHDSPKLLDNSAFMGLAMVLAGTGGLGLAGTFFFGGTKSGAEVMKSQSDAVIQTGKGGAP